MLEVGRGVGQRAAVAELMVKQGLGILPRYHRARRRIPGLQERPSPPHPREKHVGGDVKKASIRWKLILFKGVHLKKDNPSRRERGRTGAGRGGRQHNSDTALEQGSNGAKPPLESSTAPGTATGEGRRATNRAPAEGPISSRTRSRTSIAAAISA